MASAAVAVAHAINISFAVIDARPRVMQREAVEVGRVLANFLGWAFVDSDAEIEARCGADIPWIFDVEGEAGFRRREAAVLKDLAERSSVVIATGGGAVVTAENRQLMSESGVVVYLDVSIAQQLKRTGSGDGRPLLSGGDREATLRKLMQERTPLLSLIHI